MKCPHCLESFFENFSDEALLYSGRIALHDKDGDWRYKWTKCPACEKAIIFLKTVNSEGMNDLILRELQVWPKGVSRSPLPPEVTKDFDVSDYLEACLVLA